MITINQDVILRDILLLIAAIIVFIYIIFVNIKESGIQITPKRNEEEITLDKEQLNFNYEEMSYYNIIFDEAHIVWQINLFSSEILHKEKEFNTYSGFPWYEFAHSQNDSEKILSPIIRKILLKYKTKYEKTDPIFMLRTPTEAEHFYTWLKNETHTHTAVFNFLDQCLAIGNEINLSPKLSIYWSEMIYIEVIFPKHIVFDKLKNEFNNILGIESSFDGNSFSLKLWVAFTVDYVPSSLSKKIQDKEKYKNQFDLKAS